MGDRERNREVGRFTDVRQREEQKYSLFNDVITCEGFRSSVVDNQTRVWRIFETVLRGENRNTGRKTAALSFRTP